MSRPLEHRCTTGPLECPRTTGQGRRRRSAAGGAGRSRARRRRARRRRARRRRARRRRPTTHGRRSSRSPETEQQ
ncbi:hypothetical protein FGD71_040295 [Streptomyces sporangiiformans]|uniref:Uncharacterized protein n=1 Tax=Streptomyces sporangiiformans TaxID=2315329 RepID=A0A505DI96_9ACTN|nr:hypothetical protein FGD71_040295 [Streptomyces sporangiiformans]